MKNEKTMQESLTRMELLKLRPDVIQAFKEKGKVSISEPDGLLLFLNAEQEKVVRDWEKETGNMVYHVIHSFTEFGELLNLLFISEYLDEWEMERDDIIAQYPFCYVLNLDDDICSEYGSIGVCSWHGSLLRIA